MNERSGFNVMKVIDIAFRPIAAICVWLLTCGSSAAAATPCDISSLEPPPAFQKPVYEAGRIKALLTPPQSIEQLLANLKVILKESLLVQPAFFDEEVLLTAFNGAAVQEAQLSALDAVGDWVVKPSHRVRIASRSKAFRRMRIDVGWNHKCLDRRPDPRNPHDELPAATYDAAYVRLRFDLMEGFTVGAVRKVFGSTWWMFGSMCGTPLALSYPGPGSGKDAFSLDVADFYPDAAAYEELCRSKTRTELPDEVRISSVWLRVAEQDYTILQPNVY